MQDNQDSAVNRNSAGTANADIPRIRGGLARFTCALALCATAATGCDYEAGGDTNDPTLDTFRDDDDPQGDCPTGATDGCDGTDTDPPRMADDPDDELADFWIGDPEAPVGGV